MPVIFATHPLHPRAVAMLERAGDLVIASAPDTQTLGREAREADIVIVRAPLPQSLFDGNARLRAAIRHGAGLDMIPVEAATRAGVLVANVPGVNARTVAEHVFMVSMALLRRFRMMDRDLRAGGWNAAREHSYQASDLAGRTVGIVGMGSVGKEVARIAMHGFGLDVIANTRRRESIPEGVAVASVDDLMAGADIVVLCCPLTLETTGLVSRERLALMKPHALLVNVSRGAVVNEPALILALRENRIGGAALDVFATQPLPADHPLLGFDNVIVTPHLAGITEESMMRMGTGAAAEALRVLSGELPLNLRNADAVPLYRQRFAS